MKLGRLQKLRGIYPPEVPPKGAEAWDRTHAGQTVYRRKSNPRQKVPVLNDDGEQVTRGGNPMTGMPGTPMFRYVRKYPDPKPGEKPRAGVNFEWEYFTITRGKHGNNRIQLYNREQAEHEQARKKAVSAKDALLERVAQRATEIGMDMDEAVDRLLGIHEPAAPPEETPAESNGAGAHVKALAETAPEFGDVDEDEDVFGDVEDLYDEDEL